MVEIIDLFIYPISVVGAQRKVVVVESFVAKRSIFRIRELAQPQQSIMFQHVDCVMQKNCAIAV